MDISAQPSRFSSSGEELWNEQPRSGTLPREIAERLAAILPSHTQTPDSCWFGVWDGFGGLRIPRGGVGFSVPQRDLLLLHGRVDDVPTTLSVVDWSYQSPNLWWPDDKAWCVATEIDFNWTYVGGSHACVQQILNDSGLEALPTHTEEGNALEK